MKVLLALDDSPYSQTVLDNVAHRNWEPGTQFKIVNVVEPLDRDDEEALSDEDHLALDEIHRRRIRYATEICTQARHTLEEMIQGCTVDTELRTGKPAREILDAAVDWQADRLILGAHGHNVCPHNFSGSTSQSVAQHAHCTVEVVRAAQRPLRHTATAR